MLARSVDGALLAASKVGFRPLAGMGFVPVLHVERLHDESSFARVTDFCRVYGELTGSRAIATVITPVAPMLAVELARIGFGEDQYRSRIASLGTYAEIGLHGHFLRSSDDDAAPVHNYWSDPVLVGRQIEAECRWLEVHGLMHTRTYSAGWWHLNSSLVAILAEQGFVFDFTPSVGRYNNSPAAHALRQRFPAPAIFEEAAGLNAIWAVSGICGSRHRSSVPRRTLTTFGGSKNKADRVVSLYSHDWDMDVQSAVRTIRDLQSHGARFPSLRELVDLRDSNQNSPMVS